MSFGFHSRQDVLAQIDGAVIIKSFGQHKKYYLEKTAKINRNTLGNGADSHGCGRPLAKPEAPDSYSMCEAWKKDPDRFLTTPT